MLNLYETVQRIVQEELRRVVSSDIALVEEQHPDTYACTVALRDSGIVLKEVPVASGRLGVASLPAVSDLVLVQFVNGDVNRPIIMGSLYNDVDTPPDDHDGKSVLHLPLGAGDSDATRIELSSEDARELIISLGSGVTVALKDDDPPVSIETSGATISIANDGTVQIESNGDIALKSNANLSLEAAAQLSLKGSVIKVN